MSDELGFTVYQKSGITRIDNSSKQMLIVSTKPLKPKRKYTDVFIVKPLSFIIIDHPINLHELSFTLEKP